MCSVILLWKNSPPHGAPVIELGGLCLIKDVGNTASTPLLWPTTTRDPPTPGQQFCVDNAKTLVASPGQGRGQGRREKNLVGSTEAGDCITCLSLPYHHPTCESPQEAPVQARTRAHMCTQVRLQSCTCQKRAA